MVGILEKLVAERGAPEFIRSYNGPELVAREVREWIQSQGFKTLYIEPGAPWQNSYTESFNARFRDEFLNVELFSSKLEAKVLSAEHREKYNNHRPHSSLEGMTPEECAARALAKLRPTLRKKAKPTRNTNKSSHNNWIKFRGHSKAFQTSRQTRSDYRV